MAAGKNKWLLALALLQFSPTGIVRGELAHDRRLLFHFDKIEVRGEVDVFLRQGKRLRECSVYADKEIMDSVTTKVSERTLLVDANNTYDLNRRLPFLRINAKRVFPVEVIVSVRDLSEISLTGSGNLYGSGTKSMRLKLFSGGSGKLDLRNFSANAVEVIQDGSGDVVLMGNSVGKIDAVLSGTGSLYAGDLPTGSAKISLRGRGNAHLSPIDFLDAGMLSSGNVFLHDKPRQSAIRTNGTGVVRDVIPGSEPLYDLNATKPKLQVER